MVAFCLGLNELTWLSRIPSYLWGKILTFRNIIYSHLSLHSRKNPVNKIDLVTKLGIYTNSQIIYQNICLKLSPLTYCLWLILAWWFHMVTSILKRMFNYHRWAIVTDNWKIISWDIHLPSSMKSAMQLLTCTLNSVQIPWVQCVKP